MAYGWISSQNSRAVFSAHNNNWNSLCGSHFFWICLSIHLAIFCLVKLVSTGIKNENKRLSETVRELMGHFLFVTMDLLTFKDQLHCMRSKGTPRHCSKDTDIFSVWGAERIPNECCASSLNVMSAKYNWAGNDKECKEVEAPNSGYWSQFLAHTHHSPVT